MKSHSKVSPDHTVRAVVALSSLAVALAVPAALRAQGIDPSCPGLALPDRATQDACQKAVDIFAFMTPQLGIGLVGGNATLGATRALGGIGHFSIGVRGNATRGRCRRSRT